nr:hypothetical protein [Pseudorhodobacter aquimaris]
MITLYWLKEEQKARLRACYPKSRSVPRVDDLHILSSIIFINHNGLRWCDVPDARRWMKKMG